jgi:nucleotide-binding universal stress UspA family protein
MLVAPTDFAGEFTCRRIVVAWDNSRVSARALGDALMLIPGIEEVILLTIGDEKNVRSSLDQSETEGVLKRRGIAVSSLTKHLDGRTIGDAIQESALELNADLLVMGGYGHSRLRDFILGGATLSVLAHPRIPVLISH